MTDRAPQETLVLLHLLQQKHNTRACPWCGDIETWIGIATAEKDAKNAAEKTLNSIING